jgi:hypothetical protein
VQVRDGRATVTGVVTAPEVRNSLRRSPSKVGTLDPVEVTMQAATVDG